MVESPLDHGGERFFPTLRKDMEAQMPSITGTPGSGTLTGGNHNDTTDSAEGDCLLPGGGGGDSLEGSADSDRLIDDQSDGHEPRESGAAQPISATPPTASGTPMI
jgi:Ca2+-binding RTX toxin-like protein